jgi:hypothetical protein
MVLRSAGLRPKSDCSGKAQKQLYSKLQTRPLVRGRYKITNPQMSKENFKEKEKFVTCPRWAPDTKTDWPTELTLTSTSTSCLYLKHDVSETILSASSGGIYSVGPNLKLLPVSGDSRCEFAYSKQLNDLAHQ